MTKKVFITGVTGYLGGETLARLLSSSSTKSYSYSALVRNNDKVPLIESLGVRPVFGTLDDAALLSAEAESADVVIHIADAADHLPACTAILEGMKRRNDNPILIHISGAAVLMDDARGEFATETIFSDLNTASIYALPESALHRNVENLVLAVSSQVRTHIVAPCTIYGIADNAHVKMGLSNPISIQIPALIRTSIARGQTGVVGKGLNIWPVVHVTEAADAIVTIFEAALAGKTTTGREGYYFVESGETIMYETSAEVARALSARGTGGPEPTPFTDEEIKKYFDGSYWYGANARCRSHRIRQLGWQSTHESKDFLDTIGPEVDFIIKMDAEKK